MPNAAPVRRPKRCQLVLILVAFSLPMTSIGLGRSVPAGPHEIGFPRFVTEELALLKKDVTLKDWKLRHPDEIYTPYVTHKEGHDEMGRWCIRAESTLELSEGRKAVRHAFFYAPPPPSSFALPDGIQAGELLDRCVLGSIRIRLADPNEGRGEELARAARSKMNGKLGRQGESRRYLTFPGAAYWKEITCWRSGPATFFSAIVIPNPISSSPPGVLAFGYLPISDLRVEDEVPPRTPNVDDVPEPMLRSMVLSGITGPPQDEMRGLFREALRRDFYSGPDGEIPAILAEEVQDIIARWLAKADGLPDPRRAAALFAADQILQDVQRASSISDPSDGKAARDALSLIGAEFGPEPMGSPRVIYKNSWLWEAYRLDPAGPAGEMAFLDLMNRGFDTSQTCAEGGDSFRRVIERGEEYLRRPHDPKVRQTVELMVAEAYLDIMAMAAGAASTFGEDPAPYREQTPEARLMAVRHFRAGLMNAADSPEIRAAWSAAWHTLAGIPPRSLRFYCSGD